MKKTDRITRVSDSRVDPAVSKYFSELSKKRKNKVGGFKNVELAKEAGALGRLTQRQQREKDKAKS